MPWCVLRLPSGTRLRSFITSLGSQEQNYYTSAALLGERTSPLQLNVTIRRAIVWGWLAHTMSSFLRTVITLGLVEAW
eukprot:228957-Amphidinium_carterae.2